MKDKSLRKIKGKLSIEKKAELLIYNTSVFNLPLKNFKADSMFIDKLYADNLFGGYFLLEDWKESLVNPIKMSLINAYSVLVENSEAELYVVPRDVLKEISKYERV
jgi:hypothetical protein